jgi:Condensin II non structural maintenance of chromosomes subunit
VALLLCRALVAANPAVRRNALQLLVDAFPLHDPDTSQAMLGLRSLTACHPHLLPLYPVPRKALMQQC